MREQPADREARGRVAILGAIEQAMPNVIGNPFIPHWPLPAQALFLGLHNAPRSGSARVFEALYGGAAGGGKSDALLMALAQNAWKYGESAGIAFRRTHTDLAQPGALMDRAMEWWLPAGAHWNGTDKIFRFPSGARVAMAYLKGPNDHLRYQGAEYQTTCWDELTQWPTEAPYAYVGRSRVRRKADSQIPLRTLAATNPGGPGHTWVQNLFIGGQDIETGERIEPLHPYIPAYIQDNHHLDRAAYMEGLMGLRSTVRDQLLRGDWTARDTGDYFRAEWFGPLLEYDEHLWSSADCLRVRWWDLAASEKEDAKRTAGIRMARHLSGVKAIEHGRAFKATPGRRDDLIVQTAYADGRSVVVGLEVEPGSGGPAQFEALRKRLREAGFKVVGHRPGDSKTKAERPDAIRQPTALTGKEGRADPVAAELERGYFLRNGKLSEDDRPEWNMEGKPLNEQWLGVRLFAGAWTQDYLDEVEQFPEGARCDYVDATSGAWNWLELHPHGIKAPPRVNRQAAGAGDQLDNHPSERLLIVPGKDRRGHFLP